MIFIYLFFLRERGKHREKIHKNLQKNLTVIGKKFKGFCSIRLPTHRHKINWRKSQRYAFSYLLPYKLRIQGSFAGTRKKSCFTEKGKRQMGKKGEHANLLIYERRKRKEKAEKLNRMRGGGIIDRERK